jgi:anaerobic selenocysteine-containing dehydrogenase
MHTAKSYCRFCHAYCAIEVDVDDGRVVAVRGDRSDPVYGGYTCEKGRELPEALNHPERVTQTLKRNANGGYDPISSSQAFDEIAEKLKAIIEEHGPQSVASYSGTHSFQNSAALEV